MIKNVLLAPTGEKPGRLKILSVHLLQRAKHYRYAAALTDNPEDIRRLIGLAFMFERLAGDFKQFEAEKSRMVTICCHKEDASSAVGSGPPKQRRHLRLRSEPLRAPIRSDAAHTRR